MAPEVLLGLELHFMEGVATRATAPVMIVHTAPGRYVSIGRYHLYSGADARNGINVYRRLTGGRVVGAGEGWIALALILPTRSSMLKDEAAPLKPDQVMNRHVRGLLAAMRHLGLDCFYPGRDAITLERKELAMCTFETDALGAVLVEATLAVNRGMEEVVHDLERIDPNGELACRMYGPDDATKLVRELERDVTFDEIAGAVAAAYRTSVGEIHCRDLTADEAAHGEHRGRALTASGWLNQRHADPSFNYSNRIASQLGSLSVDLRIASAPHQSIDRVMFSGDFIANSPAIAALENELQGRRFDLASVSNAVTKVFASPDNFILGIGDLSNLVMLVVNATARTN